MVSKKKGSVVLMIAAVMMVFGLLAGQFALAADYPTKPITMYIPFSAGGSMDSSSRVLAVGAEKVLGQPFVMINKTGGGGTVALSVLVNEKSDGYILSAGTSTAIFRIPVFSVHAGFYFLLLMQKFFDYTGYLTRYFDYGIGKL